MISMVSVLYRCVASLCLDWSLLQVGVPWPIGFDSSLLCGLEACAIAVCVSLESAEFVCEGCGFVSYECIVV